MFRRRRSADAGQDWSEEIDQQRSGGELDHDEPFDDESAGRPPAGAPRAEGGPWDSEEPYPVQERVDLGSLLVPVGPQHEIQLVMAEQHGAWVTVKYRESELQVQAFAAARRSALWDDVPGRDRRRSAHGGRAERGDAGIVRDRADGPGARRTRPARLLACGWSDSSASTGRAGSSADCSPAQPRPATRNPATSRQACSRRCLGTSWWSAAITRYRRGKYSSSGSRPRRVRPSKSRPRPPRRRRTGSAPT